MQHTNRGFTHHGQVGPEGTGLFLSLYLARRYPAGTPSEWEARIASGHVRLDGEIPSPETKLRPGQWIAWERPPWAEPEVPFATAVLYEDDELLAVAKPSGLPTLPGGGLFLDRTLLALVRTRAPLASPMHRLGRGTSGLVLFARVPTARAPLQALLREGRIRKVYRALVQGHPTRETFDITTPIGEVPYEPLGLLHAASPQGRPSLSCVTVLERRRESTLVEVEIPTGRPHQIRIHLASAGHPLVGDPLYGPGGGPRPDTRALPGDLGYLLHAGLLDLPHPRTGVPLHLVCQPPPELRVSG